MDILGIVAGLFLIVLGPIIIKFGDREVGKGKIKGGMILSLFSHQHMNPKLRSLNYKILKWVVGIMAIWFGLTLVITGGHP